MPVEQCFEFGGIAAMARQGDIFPGLVINMVKAGEQSGALEEVLRRMSGHFARFAEAPDLAAIYGDLVVRPSRVA